MSSTESHVLALLATQPTGNFRLKTPADCKGDAKDLAELAEYIKWGTPIYIYRNKFEIGLSTSAFALPQTNLLAALAAAIVKLDLLSIAGQFEVDYWSYGFSIPGFLKPNNETDDGCRRRMYQLQETKMQFVASLTEDLQWQSKMSQKNQKPFRSIENDNDEIGEDAEYVDFTIRVTSPTESLTSSITPFAAFDPMVTPETVTRDNNSSPDLEPSVSLSSISMSGLKK